MHTTPTDTTHTDETTDVVGWRYETLVGAGYPVEDALLLAGDRNVDLHVACDLVARGCPPGTAVRIVR